MPDVFISHSSNDKEIAEDLAIQLNAFGLSVFLDSTSINPGQDWTQTILANLSGSPVMLLLASKNGIASPTVNQEVGWAMKQRCVIVPILWDMQPHELPPWIAKYQAVVFTGKSESEAQQQLARLMRHLAEQKNQRAVAALAILGFAVWAIFQK